MHRQIVTEAELVVIVNHRFAHGDELDGDCQEIKISGVQRYPVADESECNWNLFVFNGSDSCSGVFRAVIDEMRSKYNLPAI